LESAEELKKLTVGDGNRAFARVQAKLVLQRFPATFRVLAFDDALLGEIMFKAKSFGGVFLIQLGLHALKVGVEAGVSARRAISKLVRVQHRFFHVNLLTDIAWKKAIKRIRIDLFSEIALNCSWSEKVLRLRAFTFGFFVFIFNAFATVQALSVAARTGGQALES